VVQYSGTVTSPNEKRPMFVLVADDDEDDRELTRDALLEVNAGTVRFVRDGQELLDYLRNKGAEAGQPAETPDLVLLDLNMPRMNGAQALSEIRADRDIASIPVVVFTTSRDEQDVRDSYERGANSFISKPSTFADLVEAMRAFRTYWADVVNLPTS
jgi:CheY-like chemotaxis protein